MRTRPGRTALLRRGFLRGSLGLGVSIALAPRRVLAKRPYAAMALVLAVDVSSSIDSADYALQRHGIAAAFRHPEVHRAIAAQASGTIAVAVMEWAETQSVVVPWRIVDSAGAAERLAQDIDDIRRSGGGSTAIGEAIARARQLIETCPCATDRRVIDVSGDGPNNRGVLCSAMRDEAVENGIVVNGLAIESDDLEVVPFYRENVVGGPGAFLIVAKGMDDFATAIRSKLVREIA
jgi:hypothetical protein